MNQNQLLSLKSRGSILKLALWTILIYMSAWYIFNNAFRYYGLEQEVFRKYWEVKWYLIGHISGGIIALAIGPLQFWSMFRNKFKTTHRWLGRIYLTSILIASLSSLYLAWTVTKVTSAWAISLQGLALVWMVTSVMAYTSIRHGKIQQHQQWMIRSYIVTFAFVSFRWLREMDFLKELDIKSSTIIWASWTIPILLMEVYLLWRKRRPVKT